MNKRKKNVILIKELNDNKSFQYEMKPLLPKFPGEFSTSDDMQIATISV